VLIPLTVPEARRLLRISADTPERQRHGLRWSCWRRAHQATAKRCHAARRACRHVPTGAATVMVVPSTPMLTDALWGGLAPLLPPRHGKRGRLPSDHRPILDGLLWMMGTGRGWRDIPPRFGPWHTLYSRYKQWCRDGTWERIVAVMPTSPI
jgi:hypothetical protein